MKLPYNFGNLFSIFLLHAIALFTLIPSQYNPRKTAVIWSMYILLCSGMVWILLRFSSSLGLFLAFTTSLCLCTAIALFLSIYPLPKTLFLFLSYAQIFMIFTFLSGLLGHSLFQDSQDAINIIRSILHIALIIFCAVVVRRYFETASQGIITGWWPLNMVILLLVIYFGFICTHAYRVSFRLRDSFSFLMMLLFTITVYFLFFHTISYMHKAVETRHLEFISDFQMQQAEAMQESIESAKQIRHDIRHHNLQIAEYARNNQIKELLQYLEQYEEEAEHKIPVRLCENLAANNILSAYTRKAEQAGITVRLDVSLEQNIGIRDIDIVAMLANIMENAIYGCIRAKRPESFIDLFIGRKAGKLAIQSRNTSGLDVYLENGMLKPKFSGGIGVSSILYSAKHYAGETDFQNHNGLFICRILLKIPEKNMAKI